MALTNINEWANYYKELLSVRYNEFCLLFPNGEQPPYKEFVNFVWLNTSKSKNHYTGKIEAKIN